MNSPAILEKLEALPEPLQTEVLHYIEFLIERYVKTSHPSSSSRKKRQAGLLQGKIRMSDDFDAPLEDLKEYM